MFNNRFEADNSLFGATLTEVMDAHGIKVGAPIAEYRTNESSTLKRDR